MSQGNKNKIAIIGHTKGIGKAIADLYRSKKYSVLGLSRSNGFDISKDQEKILEHIEGYPLVVINAHAGRAQLELLKWIYGKYLNRSMLRPWRLFGGPLAWRKGFIP